MAEKKRKSASGGKGKKNTEKKQSQIRINAGEIVRWGLGFVAIFIILTFIPGIVDTDFGQGVSGVIRGLFGPMYYVVPFIILVVIIFWRRDRKYGKAWVKYILYLLEFIFISLIVHVIAAGENVKTLEWGQLYETGKVFGSAGFISGSVAMIFTKLIGPVASIILAILGIFICTVFLCGTTPTKTVEAIGTYIKSLYAKHAEKDREKHEKDEYEEEDEEVPVKPRKTRDPLPVADLNEDGGDDEDDGIVIPALDLPDDPLDETAGVPLPDDNDAPPFDTFEDLSAPNGEKAGTPEEPEEISAEGEEVVIEQPEKAPYVFPPISLLTEGDPTNNRPTASDIERTSRKLEEVLSSFNVKAHVVDCTCGPTVTRYELQPETGVRVKSIANLSEDIALHLAATAVRIENIPGKAAIGIEIPNKTTFTVRLRRLIDSSAFRDHKSKLYAALGEDVAGNPVYLDIAKMPHLLIAGATGMGKSVCINSLIVSLLYRCHPDEVKLILIDPKKVEFQPYDNIPHLLVPVITDPKNAAGTLNWACNEMEKRYNLIQEVGVRDIDSYNSVTADDPEREQMYRIVIFIDELADLMMTAPDDVETSICRLAQKARAAGIHLVIGTQRPSVDVVTGLIKANIPSRISCKVASQTDSRVILDMAGAEKLLGRGDMLFYPVGAMKPIRVQGAFVDDKSELAGITQFMREASVAQYDDNIIQMIANEAKLCGMKGKRGAAEDAGGDGDSDKEDPMFVDAVGVAVECGTVSTSLLQRRLSLGYARAARIVDKMERKGIIGEFDAATKKRAVLISKEEYLEMKINRNSESENA